MPTYCIIGANRGLGLEFVRQLAASADNCIIATTRKDADRADLAAVAPLSTHILDCDTASVPSVHLFAQKVVRNVLQSGQTIDYLLVSAGVNGAPPTQDSLSLDPGRFAAQIAINVVGPAKIVEFLIDHKALSPAVRILNMTSGLGSMQLSAAMVPRKYADYSMSKAALNMLTVHQAHDVRTRLPSAVVICMDPGWVKTRMGGEGALLEPEDSIRGMLAVLHALREEDNGSFCGHDGGKRPW